MAESDRMELMGMDFPAGEEGDIALMAECFAVEFARMGYSEEALLALFRNPFYRGPHLAYQRKGEEWVRALIRRVMGNGEEGDREQKGSQAR